MLPALPQRLLKSGILPLLEWLETPELVWPPGGVYWFPRAVITKCRKLGVLKQQKFILVHFRGYKSKSQGLGRTTFPRKSALFQCLPLSLHALLCIFSS